MSAVIFVGSDCVGSYVATLTAVTDGNVGPCVAGLSIAQTAVCSEKDTTSCFLTVKNQPI